MRRMNSARLSAEQQRWYRDHLFDVVLHQESLPLSPVNAIEQDLLEFAGAVQQHQRPTADASCGAQAVALAERVVESIVKRQTTWSATVTDATGLRRVG